MLEVETMGLSKVRSWVSFSSVLVEVQPARRARSIASAKGRFIRRIRRGSPAGRQSQVAGDSSVGRPAAPADAQLGAEVLELVPLQSQLPGGFAMAPTAPPQGLEEKRALELLHPAGEGGEAFRGDPARLGGGRGFGDREQGAPPRGPHVD